MSGPVLQLHGILRGAPSRRKSIHPHRMLHFGTLSALVSRCPFDGKLDDVDPTQLSERAMAHHALLVAYSTDNVLLPTRFGAFFSSIDAVRQGLARDEETYLDGLTHLANRHEYNVRLSLSAAPPKMTETPKQPLTGSQFLTERRQARIGRKTRQSERADFARAFTQALENVAAITPSGRGEEVLEVTMLLTELERSHLQSLLKEQGPAADRLGLLLAATGPWPAYSYTPISSKKVAHNGA